MIQVSSLSVMGHRRACDAAHSPVIPFGVTKDIGIPRSSQCPSVPSRFSCFCWESERRDSLLSKQPEPLGKKGPSQLPPAYVPSGHQMFKDIARRVTAQTTFSNLFGRNNST